MTDVTHRESPRIALTAAGSDSGGGAGIQGDLKTFARFGVFGTTAITAVTAQNTRGVSRWETVSPGLVRAQLETLFEDLPPHAAKTGMLGAPAVAATVGAFFRDNPVPALVVDPVLVATSGDPLADSGTLAAYRDTLLPLATIVTPNLAEASALLDTDVRTEDDAVTAARAIAERFGARAVLVKGGHGSGATLGDVLFDGDVHVYRHDRIDSTSTHGTGCALSAAITAGLASGRTLRDSVSGAIDYVGRAIRGAPGIGSGHGPLDHFA